MLTVDTSALVEEALDAALRFGHAVGVVTGEGRVLLACGEIRGTVLIGKELKDKRHTDISAVCRLLEIARSGIFVNLNGDFVDTGQRVHYAKILLRIFQLIGSQNIAVLETEIF